MNEQDQKVPTVQEFLDAFARLEPNAFKKWLGNAAKYLIPTVVGAGTALAASTVLPTAAGAGVVGIGAAALGQQAIADALGNLGEKSSELVKIAVSRMSTPDDQREPIDSWFDLDDDLETLIQGREAGLGKEFQQQWTQQLKISFDELLEQTEEDPDKLQEPVTKFLTTSASNALIKFLKNKTNLNITRGDK